MTTRKSRLPGLAVRMFDLEEAELEQAGRTPPDPDNTIRTSFEEHTRNMRPEVEAIVVGACKDLGKAPAVTAGPTDQMMDDLRAVLAAAEAWRDVMVASNRPCGGYPDNDPDGRAHWRGVNNHNGRLVQAVDRLRARREGSK